jgi:hypothetical protein
LKAYDLVLTAVLAILLIHYKKIVVTKKLQLKTDTAASSGGQAKL